MVNDDNDASDDSNQTGLHIKSWHNKELVELHTIAWKCGMKISRHYGSTQPADPSLYDLRQNHYNLEHLYSN